MGLQWILICLVLLTTSPRICPLKSAEEIMTRIGREPHYRLPPTPTDDSSPGLQVNLTVWISSLRELDDQAQTITSDVRVQASWYDSRLVYEDSSPDEIRLVPRVVENLVWIPDLSFVNARDSALRENLNPELAVVLAPRTGRVQATSRISLTTFCDMNLRFYPLDLQHCQILLGNYLYTEEEVYFAWDEVSAPVIFNSKRSVSGFTVRETSHGEEAPHKYLYILISLQRSATPLLVYVYLPSTLVTCLCMLLLWTNQDHALSSAVGGCVTLLVIVTMTLWTASYSPPCPGYLKAIDVWLLVCMLMTCVITTQMVLTTCVLRRRQIAKHDANEFELMKEEESQNAGSTSKIHDSPSCSHPPAGSSRSSPMGPSPRVLRVVRLLRVVYPVVFAVYCVVYWATVAAS